MSATGRVKVISEALPTAPGVTFPEGTTLRAVTRTKRRKNDFYETPAWCIDAIIPMLGLSEANLVVDAGSGTGAIAARVAARYPLLEVIGIEKDPELIVQARARGLFAAEFHEGNFEQLLIKGTPDAVVMNPPYSRAVEFVTHALQIVRRGGTVAALLRLSWLAGKTRREFHRKHPCDVYVLTKRPSFTGGGTDATDYAWLVWGADRGGRWYPLNAEDKPKKEVSRGRKARPRKAPVL